MYLLCAVSQGQWNGDVISPAWAEYKANLKAEGTAAFDKEMARLEGVMSNASEEVRQEFALTHKAQLMSTSAQQLNDHVSSLIVLTLHPYSHSSIIDSQSW